MKDNFNKCIELGMLQKCDNGYSITEPWQKKIYNELQSEALNWHKNGRKGNLNIYNPIERSIKKEFPDLDPLVEIELAYYLSSIAKISLNQFADKMEKQK